MSKRIVTLDFLRGFSMMVICVFHIVVTSWDVAIDVRNGSVNLFELNVFYFLIMILIFIFGYWRGLFLIISAIVNTYVMSNSSINGEKRSKILFKQIRTGFILLIWGSIVELLFNEWGMIADWGNGYGLTIKIRDIYNAEALVNIGWAMIFSSIIFYVLTKGEDIYKTKRNAIVFIIMAILVLILTPLIHSLANYAYGGDFQNWNSLPPGEDDFSILRLFVSWFVHTESPTLPALTYSFVGSAIGIYLSSDNVDKNIYDKGRRYSYIVFAIGSILAIIQVITRTSNGADLVSVFDVHVQPYWFLIFMLGMQLLAIFFLLNKTEFNKNVNLEKPLKNTLWMRRWGLLSLTIYSFKFIQYGIRYCLDFLTPLELVKSGGADFFWTIIIVVCDIMLWTLILYIWEKIKFKGSLEWFMLKIAKRKRNAEKLDPLNIQGNLYDVEPLVFVELNEHQTIKYHSGVKK